MADISATTLLESAATGAESAWREIVARYSTLVYAVCRKHRVTGADADDVSGHVWLSLVTSLATIRCLEALPGWLATTTRRECLKVLRDKERQIPDCREHPVGTQPSADVVVLEEERRRVVLGAVVELSRRDRELLTLLFSDPPASYTEISSSLGIPMGAIGPTRQRCLARARRVPSIAALLADDHPTTSAPPSSLQGRKRAG